MNLNEAKRHPLVEHARENLWGSGITTIPEEFETDFNKLPHDEQQLVRTFFTAATTSCPVPITLAEDPKYGPAYQEVRYSSVNFLYRYLEQKILSNTDFGHLVDLRFIGVRGQQDKDCVPEIWQNFLIGPSTYEGYMIPRLILDIINYSQKCELPDVAGKVFEALDIIAKTPDNRIKIIANLSSYMRELGFGLEHLSDRLFDAGYRDETPRGYWGPIFDQLNSYLPQDLNFEFPSTE